jgi:hypothetical protein
LISKIASDQFVTKLIRTIWGVSLGSCIIFNGTNVNNWILAIFGRIIIGRFHEGSIRKCVGSKMAHYFNVGTIMDNHFSRKYLAAFQLQILKVLQLVQRFKMSKQVRIYLRKNKRHES